jgi:transcriptional regulator with XRE-family HTH domain
MRNEIAIGIGRNIAAIRKSAGRTQAELAETIGMGTVSLSRIEQGVVVPGVLTLNTIATELRVPLARLFDGAAVNVPSVVESVGVELESLSESDRVFLLGQIKTWAERLRVSPKRK